MKFSDITVIKASGQKEPFSERKLKRSIKRAKVPRKLRTKVLQNVESKLYDGISTQEIYSNISGFLGKSSAPHTQARYGLKKSLMELGPSGFPFEKFIARVLAHLSYKTQTNIIIQGKCVEHEIDVIAEKNNKRFMLECKHHTQPGARSDVKVALYTQARFNDIKENNHGKPFNNVWLVTNTKASTEAIKYAECIGMRIIGWSYPRTQNLQDLIESTGLQPVTCLTTLSQEHKRQALNQGIVLCRELMEKDKLQNIGLGFSKIKISQIKKEANAVCKIPKIKNRANQFI